MIAHYVQDVVIDNAFLRVDWLVPGREFALKVEGLNPAGSIKLKTAISLLDDAELSGLLRAGGAVVESSSGNLGIALSVVCAERGYSFTCVTDPNTPPRSEAFMRAVGAKVARVCRRDANGGYLGTRIEYIKDCLAIDPDLVWLNQYANPANARAHTDSTAKSLLDELGAVDYLFVGAGTTGTLMGCVDHVARHSPNTTVIAVDTVGSVTFGFAPGPRRIPGIGTSRRPELLDAARVPRVELVDEADAVRMCRALARRGLVVGGSTGSVVTAVLRCAPEFGEGARIAAISPDLGDRYLDTVYDDEWVRTTFGAGTLEPLELPNHALSLG
ncbi:2,3-diaminopropionate biosynthesis protein SbnA [Actinokineospora sp.]|uniref:2,3-diaminopropionate biosynthesis protein SbnA n=1 Tax=Actinokineospora sp. TaxID=1872133 RepID=UPI00403760EF